jgi:hypothetical protein
LKINFNSEYSAQFFFFDPQKSILGIATLISPSRKRATVLPKIHFNNENFSGCPPVCIKIKPDL